MASFLVKKLIIIILVFSCKRRGCGCRQIENAGMDQGGSNRYFVKKVSYFNVKLRNAITILYQHFFQVDLVRFTFMLAAYNYKWKVFLIHVKQGVHVYFNDVQSILHVWSTNTCDHVYLLYPH